MPITYISIFIPGVIDGKINPKQFGFKKPIYKDFDIPDGEDDDRYLPRTNYLVSFHIRHSHKVVS